VFNAAGWLAARPIDNIHGLARVSAVDRFSEVDKAHIVPRMDCSAVFTINQAHGIEPCNSSKTPGMTVHWIWNSCLQLVLDTAREAWFNLQAW